ncbi:MAG TPA: hypothetical protein VF995_08940 [Actinomycetota bacterium]
MRSDTSRALYKRIDVLRRDWEAAGLAPGAIVCEILAASPEISPLQAHRLARGLTLAQVVRGAGQLYSDDGLMPPPGLNTSRLHEWEHWPRSGRRPGEEARDYLARFYETRQDKLGFGHDYSLDEGDSPGSEDPQGGHVEIHTSAGGRTVHVELPGGNHPTIEVDEEDGLKRRVVVMLGGLVVAEKLLPAVDPERLAWARANPSRVDLELLRDLRATTMAYAGELASSPTVRLAEPARAHLDYLVGLLHGSQPESIERRLRVITGEAAVLAGWTTFQCEDRDAARADYALARLLARQTGDQQLLAETFIPMSYLYSTRYAAAGRQTNPTKALTLLRAAGAGPGGARLAAPMRGWAAGCRAAEHAFRGEADAARRELDRAEDALAEIRPGEEHGFLAYWEQTRVDGYVGLCNLLLGRGEAAEQALTKSLETADLSLHRHRLGVKVDLGIARVLQGEIEAACATLEEACGHAERGKFPIVLRRIRNVHREHLARWHDLRVVRSLDEHLHESA